MRVYLDLCAIQRPLDDYSHVRIALEAEAVLGIIALCDAGELELVSSEALEYETDQNPWPLRKQHARSILAKSKILALIDDEVDLRATTLTLIGVKPLDSLHLALAEAAGVDYFCTCDDRFLRRIKQIQGLPIKVGSPIELIQEIE